MSRLKFVYVANQYQTYTGLGWLTLRPKFSDGKFQTLQKIFEKEPPTMAKLVSASISLVVPWTHCRFFFLKIIFYLWNSKRTFISIIYFGAAKIDEICHKKSFLAVCIRFPCYPAGSRKRSKVKTSKWVGRGSKNYIGGRVTTNHSVRVTHSHAKNRSFMQSQFLWKKSMDS